MRLVDVGDILLIDASERISEGQSTEGGSVTFMQTRHIFAGAPGACNIPFSQADGLSKPWQYIDLFLSAAFVTNVVEKTNEKLRSLSQPETNGDEISVYLWLRYYMGILNLPRLRLYWETDGIFGVPFVRDQLGRDRFLLLHANLSFDLHALEELVLSTCRKHWLPAQSVTLDEAIAAFRGRYRFKVLIRGKPHPTGLKLFYPHRQAALHLRFSSIRR